MNKFFGYIQTYEEACLVVHAVRLGYLDVIEGRLTPEERENIRSGDIFCFVESPKGMKRWTDGKVWSPSKIHGQFLLYREVPRHMNKSAIGKRNRQKSLLGLSSSTRERLIDWNDKLSFSKKTISITLQNRTYHIIAYFRPMFSKVSLTNIPFFEQLSKSLRKYPCLLEDDFVGKYVEEEGFRERFELPAAPNNTIIPRIRRYALERIAGSVLMEWLELKKQYHQER